MRFRNSMLRIMTGRYGYDELSGLIFILAAVIFVPSIFLYGTLIGDLIRLAAVITAVLGAGRTFSRNIEKREEEYRKYLAVKSRLIRKLPGKSVRVMTDKDYKYFKCPNCNAKLRVPKHKGKIVITCPKCSTEFQRRT